MSRPAQIVIFAPLEVREKRDKRGKPSLPPSRWRCAIARKARKAR
jgi:hypothetical protein